MIEKIGHLLCTFSNVRTYESEIRALAKVYKITGDRVYVLANGEHLDEIFLTFNGSQLSNVFYPRTISVHRKKDYNVLYSINALNELIALENGGHQSNQININWDKYRSSLITIKDGKLKITPTKLVKISRI